MRTVTAGWFLARAELRARLWSTLVLAVVGGVALGFALAGIAGARRGPGAFDRFVGYYNESNLALFVEDPAAVGPIEQLVAEHPGVETSATTTFVTLGDVEPDGSIARTGVAAGMIAIGGDADLERPAILRGRRPEAAFEVAVNDRVAARRHLEPGARIRLAVFGADQVDGVGRSDDEPAHGVHEFTVTGIVRSPGDLEFQAEAQPGTIYQLENEMYWYPGALWERFGGDVANYGVGVLARVAPTTDTAALEDEARRARRHGQRECWAAVRGGLRRHLADDRCTSRGPERIRACRRDRRRRRVRNRGVAPGESARSSPRAPLSRSARGRVL